MTTFRDFQRPGRSAVYAGEAMVATSHPLATESALACLRAGGNAVDAALDAVFALSVVEPHMVGVGGDLFALVAEPDGTLHGLNASGRAGRAADAARLRAEGLAAIADESGHAVTVPGMVKGAEALCHRFGRFGLDRALARAVALAEGGFPVAPRAAFDWAANAAKLARHPGARRHLMPNGAAPKAGDVVAFPALANTLKAIARAGATGFYEGEIAADIVATVQAAGGILDENDLAGASADWVAPVSRAYRGLELVELPPNAQGVFALLQLALYERLPIAGDGVSGPARIHLVVEAARAAYALRDSALADAPRLAHPAAALFSDETADALAGQIDPLRRNPRFGLPKPWASDTTILVAVDRDRRVCVLIASLYSAFGTGIATERTGILLHNRGAHFSLFEGHPNEYAPGVRPRHTLIPALIRQGGEVVAGFGVMGGDYQATGHATVLSNIADFGLDPQAAIDAPRAFFDEAGNALVETSMPDATVIGLEARGHCVVLAAKPIGGGQMIWLDRSCGVLIGASDGRKDGSALGY